MSYESDQRDYQNAIKGDDTRESEPMRKMFVGGLSRSTTEATFYDHFAQYGEIIDKVIITDPFTKESRGFGFVTYGVSDSVENAFKARPHTLDGKQLDVKRAMPREYNTPGAHAKTKKLFVGGFKGSDLTPEELQAYIEERHSVEFGKIEKIDFFKDNATGQTKGFGFLECTDTDFADRLAISENSFKLKGKFMSIKKAEPREGAAGGPPPRGGGRGGDRGGRGGDRGGRGRGGDRGGRGRGGDRGGYDSGYGGNRGGYDSSNYGNYSTSYPTYGQNQGGGGGAGGYNNYSDRGYGSGAGGGGYEGGRGGGYSQGGGNYSSSGAAGGYGNGPNSYGGGQGGYTTAGYGQGRGGGRGGGAPRGGRGGSAGGQRYQPY